MAGKHSGKNRISPNEERLNAGIALHRASPLFSRLDGIIRIAGKEQMGKQAAGLVRSDGVILLNRDLALNPPQWAYVVAHCQLHLAFGHFDGEKMPGYQQILPDGSGQWKVSCNKALWNAACDLYIAKFLSDVKFGAPPWGGRIEAFPMSLTDEQAIYRHLLERGHDERDQEYGTGAPKSMDMAGLEHPIFYDEKKGQKNLHMVNFAYALSCSVSHVVREAAGRGDGGGERMTPAREAAQWFISRYPLLGGLAAGFKIIMDYQYCQKEEISVAAVDVTCGEIYVNPAAGLEKEELRFVLAHEFLHAGLQHYERRQGRDPYLWNVACDYVINGWLMDMGIGEMPQRGGLYDESLKNISAENLYDRIIRDLRRFSREDTFRGYGKGDMIGGQRKGAVDGGAASLDDFYRNALQNGLEYHQQSGRGFIPAGLIEEIRALAMPPVPWDVELARWFDSYFPSLEKRRSYARPSRRQGSTPDIPRPSYITPDIPENSRTFGVVIDTSGSMSARLIGLALGAVASYAQAREVPFARVVFCDATAYDAGYLAPEDIAGRVQVKGRGGTILQPGVDLLERAKDFPKDGPVLIITDGEIENDLKVKREHGFLIPRGKRLPFRAKGKVFYFRE